MFPDQLNNVTLLSKHIFKDQSVNFDGRFINIVDDESKRAYRFEYVGVILHLKRRLIHDTHLQFKRTCTVLLDVYAICHCLEFFLLPVIFVHPYLLLIHTVLRSDLFHNSLLVYCNRLFEHGGLLFSGRAA